MKKSLILCVHLAIWSCNSPTIKKQIASKENVFDSSLISLPVIQEKGSSTSPKYDTLFSDGNMRSQTLADKIESSQERLGFYKKFISEKRINKLKTIKEKHSEVDIKYLGVIKVIDKKEYYHVITNFTVVGIGQIPSPRGHSEMAFINEQQDEIIIYSLSMPYELPEFIKDNMLFFDLNNTKTGISLSGGLPSMFCIPTSGCY